MPEPWTRARPRWAGTAGGAQARASHEGGKRDEFVDPDAPAVAFSLDLAAKDMGLILDLADHLGVAMPQARVNRGIIDEASAHLGPDRDFSAVAALLRELAKEGATT
ncbi:MAG: NAD-binding protein [Chloroflexi bacterium]|nr:NAD-binding protein [Chloroflexota bacterium]